MEKEKITEIFSRIKNDKKCLVIIACAVFGIILTVISSVFNVDETEASTENCSSVFDEAKYTEDLENKLEGMVSLINGAGECRVIITLDCDYETVYARDGSLSKDDKSTDEDSEYIIIDTDRTQGGLLLKTVTPKVRGVAVVCAGGDSTYVKSAIIEMMTAVLDVGANHISVAKIKL